ncbi:MAG: FMN-binding protein [Bifidobacteriaceae bacterium]|jgi:major membrane immunogen (membrane-anchored lipoprotein)|nr:FMN-binding protein [Bifidobacteriaceae bacterium]
MARLVRLGGLGVFGALGLAACGADTPPYDSSLPLADGVWVGESAPDEEGAFGRSTVTVSGGKITGSQYVTVQANGSMKGEDYGKDSSGEIANRSAYRAAQKAVSAFDVYARDLIEVGVPADVDVVSGATIAHGQFLEAATEALTESQMAAERGRTGPAGGGSESGGPADG